MSHDPNTMNAEHETKEHSRQHGPHRDHGHQRHKKQPKPPSTLPYFIEFASDGTPIAKAREGAKVVDVQPEDFPIAAKIRKVANLSLVTYEGSCEVLVVIGSSQSTQYHRIIIEDEQVCAAIQP